MKPLDDATRKRVDTLRAQAALLAGSLLIENDFGKPELVLTRWCFTKAFSLAQIDELEALLQQMARAAA